MVAPFESASRSLAHRRSISDVPCRFTDTPVELPLSCFPDRDLRRAPPLGVRLTLAPFRQERSSCPCLGGTRLFAPKRLPSFIGPTRCVPRGVAPFSPWPGFSRSSRARFTPRFLLAVPRSRQRGHGAVPVLAHSDPKGSLRSLQRVIRRARRADVCSPHSRFSKTSTRVSLATGSALSSRPLPSPMRPSVHGG